VMTNFNKSKSHIQCRQSAATLRKSRGFTLVEIMITVTILAIVMASMIPTFNMLSKGMAALGNYSSMSMSSRNALEHFSRDVHMAETLLVASEGEVRLVLPSDAGSFVINYEYDANAGTFTRKKYAADGDTTPLKTTVLLSDIFEFDLVFYNRLDDNITEEASILTESKTIQLNAKLVKNVINQRITDYIISARFLMRNV
jgi:prepilin-type N-terminal cleavage/methylation domain-containing protein